jgi:hypothetical protein
MSPDSNTSSPAKERKIRGRIKKKADLLGVHNLADLVPWNEHTL